jgi:hypothetical protein
VAERAVRWLVRGVAEHADADEDTAKDDDEDTGRNADDEAARLGMVKEVQWIAAYVVLHWMVGRDDLQAR